MESFEKMGSLGMDINMAVTSFPPAATANYYKVLNVDPPATKKEIREAYLRLKSAYCGENQALYSLMSEEEAKAQLAQIEDAWATLQDDILRERYDRSMRGGFTPLAALSRENTRESMRESRDLPDDVRGAPEVKAPPRGIPLIRTTAPKALNESVQSHITNLISEGDPADGDLLRRIRESAGVDLDEMQERTKILSDYIRGIEENRFERLPPTVYVRGFIRSYLKYLGVAGAEKIVNAYGSRLEEWRNSQRQKQTI